MPPKMPAPMAATSARVGVTHRDGRLCTVVATSLGGVADGFWLCGVDIIYSFLVNLWVD
jgi:hypothetical protein